MLKSYEIRVFIRREAALIKITQHMQTQNLFEYVLEIKFKFALTVEKYKRDLTSQSVGVIADNVGRAVYRINGDTPYIISPRAHHRYDAIIAHTFYKSHDTRSPSK